VNIVTAKTPMAFVIDKSNLFWTDNATASVMGRNKDGGITKVLAAKQYGGFVLAQGAEYLYWYTDNQVRRVNKAGGAVTPILDLPGADANFVALAVDTTALYATNGKAGTVVRVAASGGKATVLAKGQDFPVAITLDADHVYWANRGADSYNSVVGTINKVSKAGGSPVELAKNQRKPNSLAVDSTHVYWTAKGTNNESHTDGAVLRVAKNGGESSRFVADLISPKDIQLGSSHVYWVSYDDKSGRETVMSCPTK